MILNTEPPVLYTRDFRAEHIDARVLGGFVRVRLGGEFSEDERVCDHVVDVVAKGSTKTFVSAVRRCLLCGGYDSLSVGKVIERTMLVDDAHGSFLGADANALDVIRALAHGLELLMQNGCSLDGRLGMELSWVRDLEEHVLHDVRAEGHLELEWLALDTGIKHFL